MTVYAICYDLNRPGQKYDDLIVAIKGLSGTWWHALDSTWLIVHQGTASSICKALKPHIDANDELLVVKLDADSAWVGFDAKASAWLKTNL